ncbi:MAG: hypothetical protein BYD32DRAFT_422813 [Podila humilis]|nr:MAG: hypothetical protein BYD32DRAFT_422813 [Podila humilis]
MYVSACLSVSSLSLSVVWSVFRPFSFCLSLSLLFFILLLLSFPSFPSSSSSFCLHPFVVTSSVSAYKDTHITHSHIRAYLTVLSVLRSPPALVILLCALCVDTLTETSSITHTVTLARTSFSTSKGNDP